MLFARKIGVRLIISYKLIVLITKGILIKVRQVRKLRILPLALTALYLLTLCEGNAERISGRRILIFRISYEDINVSGGYETVADVPES